MGGHEGWDSELFVEAPDESDLCGICCEVLEDAVETQCGHTFCEKCIRGWLKQREVCPQDQNPLNWGDCRPMVRDRRRILGLRVKCPFDDCGEEMELRQLRDHQKICEHKPGDWVDPRDGQPQDDDEPPLTPVKPNADDDKLSPRKEAEPEFVIELNPDVVEEAKGHDPAAERERKAKEQEEKDRAFAAQMQREEQQRAARAKSKSQARPASVQQRAAWGEPNGGAQALELAPAQDDGIYQDLGYQAGEGRPEGMGAGVDGAEILRPPKKTRCCNDKIWCCFCCVFWILILAIGAWILVAGGIDQAKADLGV